jgi:hypothetical protein
MTLPSRLLAPSSLFLEQAGAVNVNEVKEAYAHMSAEISNNKRTIQLKQGVEVGLLHPVTFHAWPKLTRLSKGTDTDSAPLRLMLHPYQLTRLHVVLRSSGGPEYVVDRVGLILPTSLCSGQVAELIAQHLNGKLAGRGTNGVTRFVALPHTGTRPSSSSQRDG